MGSIILAALKKIFIKLIAAVASRKLLEWLLFWVADLVVKSTKNTHDDKFLEKIKAAYEEPPLDYVSPTPDSEE